MKQISHAHSHGVCTLIDNHEHIKYELYQLLMTFSFNNCHFLTNTKTDLMQIQPIKFKQYPRLLSNQWACYPVNG